VAPHHPSTDVHKLLHLQATKPKKAASSGGKVPDVPDVTIDN
jgi:hypothetical protein